MSRSARRHSLRRVLGYWPDLTAFNDIVGNATLLAVLALVVVNVAFGLAHPYQGPSGVIQATVGGVLLGVLYLLTGRNLIARKLRTVSATRSTSP